MPGGEIVFHVADPAEMPAMKQPVMMWGEDTELSARLASLGINCLPFTAEARATDGVILASHDIPPTGGKAALDALLEKVEDGAQVFFLDPEVFASGSDPTAHLPLAKRGTAANPFDTSCYYAKDEWAKAHPIFSGLPSGGILDFGYYRELLADRLWQGQDTPDETVAGAIATSSDITPEHGSPSITGERANGSSTCIISGKTLASIPPRNAFFGTPSITSALLATQKSKIVAPEAKDDWAKLLAWFEKHGVE